LTPLISYQIFYTNDMYILLGFIIRYHL